MADIRDDTDDALDPSKRKPMQDNLGMGPVRVAAPMSGPSLTPAIGRPVSDTGVPMYNQGDAVPATGTAPPVNPHIAKAQQLEQEGSGVSQVQAKHPFWGGVLRGLDIAGSIVNPNITAAIPGTTLHHDALIRQQEGQANQDLGQQHVEAQTAEEQAKAQAIANPQPKEKPEAEVGSDKVVHSYEGADGKEHAVLQSTADGSLYEQVLGDVNQKDPAVNQEQQFLNEYKKQHPDATVAQAQRAYKLNSELPQRPPQITVMVPAAQGGYTPTVVHPGQNVPEGAVTPSGMSSLNVPTAGTRTMAETAPKVIDLANRVGQLVDQQVSTLGPAASRWNEFMAGKVGEPNPEFTKLRTDVGLLQTALMRMHVGARGGQQIMEHFQNLIDSSKQSPENLKAALDEIKAYAQEVQNEGRGGASETGNTGAAPKPGTVEGGYRFKGGNAADKNNWEPASQGGGK